MNHLPARMEDIPASLVDVAEEVGIRPVLALIEAFGGLEMSFPESPSADHRLVKALGEADAKAICSVLGGQTTYVPRNAARKTASEVRRLELEGLGPDQIARKLKISVRHVRRLLIGSDDPRQGRLL
jgi:hypothetical protein